jgi:hypothetical protein
MEEDQPVQNPLYFFKESFSPVVLVLSTPEVDSAFKKNGDAFSLVNLLNVFTTIIPPGTYFCVKGQCHQIHSLVVLRTFLS